jgi:hypothetical protein
VKVAGKAQVHAPIDKVWAALNDPAVLVRTIPGCERLEETGPDAYEMTVTAGVASIKGTYAGNVAIADQQEPSAFVMKASGAGGPGTVSTVVSVALAEDDGVTTVSYDADATVGGVVGGVGQRMLTGVAKKMAAEFFANVDAVLTGKEVLTDDAAAPGQRAATATDEAGAQPGPGVYLAPAKQGSATRLGDNGFLLGAIVGAAIALVGVLVGSRGRKSAR